MILILSSNIDNSTNDVLDWIYHLDSNAFVKRINDGRILDEIFSVNISNNNINLMLSNNIKLEDIKTVWYRRFIYSYPDHLKNILSKSSLDKMNISQRNEFHYATNSIFNVFSGIYSINNFYKMKNDKSFTLLEANEIGLKIPQSIITNSKKELTNFYYQNNKNIVIKSIYNLKTIFLNGRIYQAFTTKFNPDFLSNNKIDQIFPVLAQENIQKKFEIRSFFLDNKFYSMAIFSQKNKNTSLDFRNLDFDNPNRTIPYILPRNTEQKLKKLFNKMGINSGSVDLIKDKSDNIIFLEINPVGQFGMTSYPSNFGLEKKIAEHLIYGKKTKK